MLNGVARVVIQTGPFRDKLFRLPPSETVAIGRARDCLVQISSTTISRHHAFLCPAGSHQLLRDNGSSNGTYVNGTRVKEKLLESGDTIIVGDTELLYLTHSDDSLIGRTLGGYRIEEYLGAGGMGTVYRAQQRSMERIVALKVLPRELSDDAEFIARFIAEARAAAKLSHPNVVQVHDVGQDQGLFFLSMEYMEGGSLQDLLAREGQLPPKRALPMVLDAARALVWAQEKGIVHRDIKPANLLLEPGGRVKVADFGLAADLRRSGPSLDAGKILGTPQHMAPEQTRRADVDHRADIYALGSTLYTALAGAPAFSGRSRSEVLRRKQKNPPPSLLEVVPGLPVDLARTVERMMAREPEHRFQNSADAFRALAGCLKRLLEEKVGEPTAPPSGQSRRLPRPNRKGSVRRFPPVALATSVLLAAGLAMYLQSTGTRPERDSPKESLAPTAPPDSEVLAVASEPPAKEAAEESAPIPPPSEGSLSEELEALLLQGSFDEAESAAARSNPKVAAAVAMRISAAKRLHNARSAALELEEAGDHAGARHLMEECARNLQEPFASEASLAIEAIRRKEDSATGAEPSGPPTGGASP